jgi:hypothetical protein
MSDSKPPARVEAKSFQEPLAWLAETIFEKVFREGVSCVGWPQYVSDDISMMLRYSRSIYNLLFYLNADERRTNDLGWRMHYGVTAMSMVRSLIDCLYNVTAILEDPVGKGAAYRKSGIKRTLDDLEADRQAYAGQPEWDEWVNSRRGPVELLIRMSGFTLDDVMKQPMWPTLGTYLRLKSGVTPSDNQQFLKTFTHLEWRQYSALSHGAYEAFIGTLGNVPVGSYYVQDFLPHDDRPKVDASYDLFLSTHLGRAATVLLCLLTEVQAYCRFDGAHINERICAVWQAMIPLFEAKEVYDGRYSKLMADKGISPRP